MMLSASRAFGTMLRASGIAATALALASAGHAMAAEPAKAVAAFKDVDGKELGRATLMQAPKGVLLEGELSGIPPGRHGFHIHAVGRCDASGGFESAGPHHATTLRVHGFRADEGPHAGDLPNQVAGDDGRLRISVYSPGTSLGHGEGTLFDGDGSALVLHARADDYRSQPEGDSGDRIACAVIEREGG